MDREELSLGSALTAAVTVLYSPEVVVPARTTNAPDGGEVRATARTASQNERATAREAKRKERLLIVRAPVEAGNHRFTLISGDATDILRKGRPFQHLM